MQSILSLDIDEWKHIANVWSSASVPHRPFPKRSGDSFSTISTYILAAAARKGKNRKQVRNNLETKFAQK